MSARSVPIGSSDYTLADLADLLTQSRELIKDETRWCTGSWVEGLYQLKPGEDPATCTNVRMCSMGAVLVVRFDGLISTEFHSNPDAESEEEFFEAFFKRDPMAAEAWKRLNLQADEMGEASIIDLNDGIDERAADHEERFAHLQRVLDCFTATIEDVKR